MAFDWTKVEGYDESMSADEKLALLEKIEEPKPEAKKEEPAPAPKPIGSQVSKQQYDKVSSELAALKKQLRSKMTEDEQREADRLATEEAMKSELAELRREKQLSTHKASYLSLGFDEELADLAATAMTDGDSDAVFAAMKKHMTNYEKTLRAQILKESPVPPAGDNPSEEAKKKKELNELRASFGLPLI